MNQSFLASIRTIFKTRKMALLSVVLAAILGGWVPHKITVTVTPSLNKRIFWINGKPPLDKPLLHRYVMFRLPDNPFFKESRTDITIKRVDCAEGDFLELKGLEFFCNGKRLGIAKTMSLAGVPVEPFRFKGTIPDGMLFIMGDHKDSFDSRYALMGFLNKSEVVSEVTPLY